MDDIGTSPRADQLGVGAISHQLRCTGDVIALDHLKQYYGEIENDFFFNERAFL